MTNAFRTLDQLDVTGKKVLVRMDLNVPMDGGRVRDMTRITRQLPTIEELRDKGAKVIIISHLGRPDGKYDPALSLAALVDPLSEALGGAAVRFGLDCVGPEARSATEAMRDGEVLLLENLRFHAGEEANDAGFARALAELADVYVNDAFSCSHRAHASVVGITAHLPAAAGRLMQAELETLEGIFSKPEKPLAAVVGGAKISTKLAMLDHLIGKVDKLIIGGAMAHTFLVAQGHKVGKSLFEPDLVKTAQKILDHAAKAGCEIILPVDVVTATQFAAHAPCRVAKVAAIPPDAMALDIGPRSTAAMMQALEACRTVVWNGPLGAFETPPFDAGTVMLARAAAAQTQGKKLHSVAGGGDTVAALAHAGLFDEFSYLSTAGGAFLEWLEGKPLPGVAALSQGKKAA